ncbi:MAG: amino acid-binding protein [Phycisphaerae bacterium]|nr:amino acid-binding protein [Phycisphaerae bacterium]
MDLLIERVNVWAAPIPDEPGGLARVLAGLRDAGADLNFVIARRGVDKHGEAVAFVTPIRGDREMQAAGDLGFNVASSVHSLCIEGDNAPGVGATITETLAQAGINLRGFSAAVIGTRFIAYIGFDSEADAEKARAVLAAA